MKINISGVKGVAEFKGIGWKIMDIASTADFVHEWLLMLQFWSNI